MKTTTMSFADSLKFKPEKPELWASRSYSWDVTFKRWPSRRALLVTLEMQDKREHRNGDWRPLVKRVDGEHSSCVHVAPTA